MEKIELNVNGENISIEIEEKWTLMYVLRELLDLTGVKCGCNTGDCGACKVIIDGNAVNSCLIKAVNAQGKAIETVEGLAVKGKLHPIQQTFIESGAIQCGYCTPGMILSAKALLDKNQNPTDTEICQAIDKNLCRCTGYYKIIEAIQKAARMMQGE